MDNDFIWLKGHGYEGHFEVHMGMGHCSNGMKTLMNMKVMTNFEQKGD